MRPSTPLPPALALLLALAGPPNTARGAAIGYDFGGVITRAASDSGVEVGQRFSGSFSYDPDRMLGYSTSHQAIYGPLSADSDETSLTIEIAGQVVYQRLGGMPIQIQHTPAGPTVPRSFRFTGYHETLFGLPSLLFEAQDRFPPDFGIHSVLRLEDFTKAVLSFSLPVPVGELDPSLDDPYEPVAGRIDTLTPHPVPEPGCTVAVCLGLVGILGLLRNRARRVNPR